MYNAYVILKLYIDALYVYYINIILCVYVLTINQKTTCGGHSRILTNPAALQSFFSFF